MARTPKTAPKMVSKKEPVITLTQEQFDVLRNLVFDNRTEELEELATGGEDDLKTIGFTLGLIYTDLKQNFKTLDDILDDIEPPFIWNEDEEESI